MPHLTVEHTTNLTGTDFSALLTQLNLALGASQLFDAGDIKSRAVPLAQFRVGHSDSGQAFVHARLALLSGRAPEVRRELGQRLLAVLEREVAQAPGLDVQLCVEVQEIERESYAKSRRGVASPG